MTDSARLKSLNSHLMATCHNLVNRYLLYINIYEYLYMIDEKASNFMSYKKAMVYEYS